MKKCAAARPGHFLFRAAVAGCLAMLLAVPGARAADGDWPLHGRDAGEQRFSPLTSIDTTNVKQLGLAWQADLDSTRGLEATPIVVDGVMYVTSTWSRVFALDARTGAVKWTYDPEVPRAWARKACCDVVNRGVAVDRNRVFVGSLDGRLIAIDAKTGKRLWEKNTIDRTKPYTITGAPRVVKDMVVIGNGGADFGARGYVTAYDVKTGAQRWRFYTVPAGPNGPFENPELEAAAKTWDPKSRWEMGGGGTVWDSMAYDADLDLLYVGTGNGSPWPGFVRSPGGGDNLYLSSILALKPDTGRLVWHYQTTPGDSWDYTATQHMILADIDWKGSPRKVLMQAPKNGFFYVIDRATGQLLAADKYVRVTWATHVDLATGRPVMTGTSDYSTGERIGMPSTLGGHNWHPMSFSPQTGLVYIPAQDAATNFAGAFFNVLLGGTLKGNREEIVPDSYIGGAQLLAWDPIRRAVRWRVLHTTFSNAGVLSTAGGLVIQGDAEGFLNFYDAGTGALLNRIEIGTGIIAPPISYQLDGVQYVSLLAGWGGALFSHAEPPVAARRYMNQGRVITLKLGGGPVPLPPAVPAVTPQPTGDRTRELNEQQVRGRNLYIANCGACHSWYGHNGLLPDLRRSAPTTIDALEVIVLQGALESRGMPSFAGDITPAQLEDLKAYLRAIRIE
jgi:quinohemoprotein ethanol dehydrogenase